MAKKNVLQNFLNYTVAENESESVKGGRSNNVVQINTGSYGFIDWGDVEIRNEGIVVFSNMASVARIKTKG